MRLADAQRVSSGALRAPTPTEAQQKTIGGTPPGLVGAHTSGALRFESALYFKGPNNSLDIVQLTLTSGDRSQLVIDTLRGIYGEPVENRRTAPIGTSVRWRNDKDNMSIELYTFPNYHTGGPDSVIITYKPLRSTNSSGL